MKRFPLLLAATLAVVVAGCAPQDSETSAEAPAEAAVEATEASVAYQDKCDAWSEQTTALIAQLEAHKGESTIETVLEPYNEILHTLDNMESNSSLFFNAHPDPATREIAGACEEKYSSFLSQVNLSRPIYEAVSAVNLADLDDETVAFVERKLRDFRLHGVDKDDATRARITQLNEEITKLGQEFNKNIAGDVRYIEVDSAEELAGMPQDWIDAHPPGENGKIRITTDYPDFLPFRRYAESDELRQALYMEYTNRGYPANDEILRGLATKRNELAQLTGFDTWSDAATADKMIQSAAAAREFITGGAAASEERANQDYAEVLERLRQIDPDAERVEPWQSSYLGNLVRIEKYDLNVEALRPYFEYSKVRQGIFDLMSEMYGVTIEPREAAGWHPDVESYQLAEGDEVLGHFFLDMHPREDKFKHAAHFSLVAGQRGTEVPASALVCNFPGGGGETGYLDKDQVETFLHEFGHLIHYLFSHHQRWNGLSRPERDFIEAPSMMLEEWIYDAPTLQRFATNDAGEPIPDEMVQKMAAARDFGQGLFINGQMFYSDISLSLYEADPATLELLPLVQEVQAKYPLFPHIDGTHMYTSFGHLDNYSAYYYTYMWSYVIAMDMFSRFDTEGLLNKETARDYREKVLEPGGAKPAAELVEDFLGRPYNFEAFESKLTSGS